MRGHLWVSAWKFFMGDFQCCNLAKVNILRLAKQSDLIGMNCICTFGPAFAFVRFRKLYHTLRTGLLVSILCTSPRDQFLYVFFLTLGTLRSFENKQSHVSLSAICARKVYICVEKKYLPIPFFGIFCIIIKINWFLCGNLFPLQLHFVFLFVYFYHYCIPF